MSSPSCGMTFSVNRMMVWVMPPQVARGRHSRAHSCRAASRTEPTSSKAKESPRGSASGATAVTGNGNTVRTDIRARLLRERAGELDQLAASAPAPVSRRLTANAAWLRDMADTHDATAQSAKAIA